jgi:hypothetical protein
MDREFNRTKDCIKCRRYIDEETVKLKKITIGGDTYRQTDPEFLAKLKYEKICTDCFYNKA